MPIILTPEMGNSGNVGGGDTSRFTGSDSYPYKYPQGLDLRPSSELHKRIVERVLLRADESYNVISVRHAAWKAIDESLSTYIETSTAEQAVQALDSRKPVSLVIPQLYATREIFLTYYVMAFLDQPPLFGYQGVDAGDTEPAKMLEVLVDQQCHRFKAEIPLYVQFSDSITYGIGAVAPVWRQVWAKKVVKEERELSSVFAILQSVLGRKPATEAKKGMIDDLVFEGNELINIDPYMLLPDPNYPIQRFQDGEFFGYIDRCSVMELLGWEQHQSDIYFNGRYVKDMGRISSRFDVDNTGRNTKSGMVDFMRAPSTTRPVTNVNMYVNLIPSEWGLGPNQYPEKWFFSVSNDSVVTQCRPLNLAHGKFPVAIAAPELDGYSLSPVSRLETMSGLQNALSWFFNTHVANVRKALNDVLIYDPSVISTTDLVNPQAAGLVRVRKEHWGRPGAVADGVQQLKITDITRGHVADMEIVMDIMQRTSGAVDILHGLLSAPGRERVTATESRMVGGSAMNRVARGARLASVMSMRELGYMLGSHTQQFMSRATAARLVGDWTKSLQDIYGQNIKVDPFGILCDYDVVCRDGSIPVDVAGAASTWVQLFQSIMQVPELHNRFDVVKVFKHIARLLGAKNVGDFEIQAQVAGREQIARGVQAGNLVRPEEIPAPPGQGVEG